MMPYAGYRTSIILILVRALAWQCPARTAAPAASEDTTQQAQERVHTDAPRVPESADAEDEAIEEEAAEETVDADAAQGGSAEAFEEDTADATVDVDAGNPADSSARLQELNRILRIRDATNMAAETISQATCLEILGVAADAPLSDLRRRYRYLILLLHPDKCSLARAGEASIAVNRAYEVSNTGGDAGPASRDEDVRAQPMYDHMASEWDRQNSSGIFGQHGSPMYEEPVVEEDNPSANSSSTYNTFYGSDVTWGTATATHGEADMFATLDFDRFNTYCDASARWGATPVSW